VADSSSRPLLVKIRDSEFPSSPFEKTSAVRLKAKRRSKSSNQHEGGSQTLPQKSLEKGGRSQKGIWILERSLTLKVLLPGGDCEL